MMRYMVIENFTDGPEPVYARFQEKGRMLPSGVEYVDSWITSDLKRCYQIMSCDDLANLDTWMSRWSDIVNFEVVPVLSSSEALERLDVSSGG